MKEELDSEVLNEASQQPCTSTSNNISSTHPLIPIKTEEIEDLHEAPKQPSPNTTSNIISSCIPLVQVKKEEVWELDDDAPQKSCPSTSSEMSSTQRQVPMVIEGYQVFVADMETESNYLCTKCGKEMKSRSGYSIHIRRHENKAPYKCCGQLFYTVANYQRHRCNTHGEAKTHKCLQCSSKFGTKWELKKHIKTTHMERAHACDICGKQFSEKCNLRDHLNSHDRKKTHVCTCSKAFIFASGLSRHKLKCKK